MEIEEQRLKRKASIDIDKHEVHSRILNCDPTSLRPKYHLNIISSRKEDNNRTISNIADGSQHDIYVGISDSGDVTD
jgi:hypothetical protein